MSQNPYINGSDADIPDRETRQRMEQMPSNTDRKEVFYVDDYYDNPPSYSSLQADQNLGQSSSTAMREELEAIPMEPYYESSPTEPETAPLMAGQDYSMPSAPPLNQVELALNDISNSRDKPKQRRRCSCLRVLVAFTIFATGIVLMSTALAGYTCYDKCKENESICQECPKRIHKGLTAAMFTCFILTTICLLVKLIKCLVI